MADIRINSLPTTATSFNTDDYIALDGASGGTRKMLAATLPLTDVTFGTSGPSAKSSIAARAARQGLVFDGTGGVYTGIISGPSTNDFTTACWVNPTSFAASGYLFGNSQSGSFYLGVRVTTGALFTGKSAGASFADTTFSLTAGKNQLLVRVKSGSSVTWYLNGVAIQSGITDSNDYNGGFEYYGSANSSAAIFTGTLIPLIYNRALSAAEVVALYEAGVPAGGDYNTASNTSIITGANSDFSSDTGYWTRANGATISGGKANLTGGANSNILRSGLTAVGKRYRMTVTVGTADGSAYISDGSTTTLVTGGVAGFGSTGTKTFEFSVPTGSVTGIQIVSPAGTLVLDDLLFYPLGLLLAPDAGQAGGGLTWYDTSGNAANITLPASGVSWNVPSSSKVATGWAFGGNVLVGTTTDSANGKLQLTSHTTSAGGIGFGTDWGIYRKSQYTLGLNVASGAKPLFFYTDVTNVGLFDQADVNTTTGWSGYYITPGDKALKLATNSTTALTLDSSQNATFAGRIKSSDQTTVSLTASTAYNLIATSDVLTVNTLANSIVMLTVTGSDGVDGGFCGYYLLNLNVAFGTYTVTTIASGLPQNAGSAYTFTFTLDANYLKVTCGKNTGFRYNYSVLEGPNLS